eukprot:scaffold30.g4451.t1
MEAPAAAPAAAAPPGPEHCKRAARGRGVAAPRRAAARRAQPAAPPARHAPQEGGGAWRYVGGHTFLESVPRRWRYADLMFSLAEKVDGAVSVKYQLPGEELDPDSLISVADDGDIEARAGPCGGEGGPGEEGEGREAGGRRRGGARAGGGRRARTRRKRGALGERLRARRGAVAAAAGGAGELFDEYVRALCLPGTPVKTFRLRMFLFPASEDPYTPEDMAQARRPALAASHERFLGSQASSGAGAARAALLRDALREGGSLAKAFSRASGATPAGSGVVATPSPYSSAYSSGSAAAGVGGAGGLDRAASGGDGTATPPSAADAELAWEAGFRAGQEAAARAAEEEWQSFVTRRMAELSRNKSATMLGALAAERDPPPWPLSPRAAAALARRPSCGLDPGAGGGSGLLDGAAREASAGGGSGGGPGAQADEDEAEEAAVAAELAAAAAAGDPLAAAAAEALMLRGLAAPLPPTVPPSVAASVAASAPGAGLPAVSAAVGDAAAAEVAGEREPDAEFQSMFESKYERSAAAPPPGGGGRGGTPLPRCETPPPGPATAKAERLLAGGGAPRPRSPDSLLPKHISVFGDGLAPLEVELAGQAALAAAGARLSAGAGVALPSHISEFGGEDDAADGAASDAMLSVLKAALPEGDVGGGGGGGAPHPPRSLQLPTSFELLAAAGEGLSPNPSPRLPPPGAEGGGAGLATDAGALPRQPSALARSPSIEQLLSRVQRIEASQVAVLAKIGEGAFGEVSLADCPTYGRVAVKWIKPTKVERHWASFWHEAELMSRLNHPNVLRFYGLVVEGPLVVGIMTEFAASGSLAAHLRSGVGFIPLRQRTLLALHAVNGMAYLHAQHVVHFDVKPDNLLVDGDWLTSGAAGPTVKVADFGLSKHKYNTFCSNVHDLRGTLPYMAPEMIMDHQRVTEKADVWSLGVVFWELLTLQVPYADMPPAQLIGALGLGKLRLPIPDWCEPEWRALMEACWVADPAERPTCRQLAVQLERVRDLAPQ